MTKESEIDDALSKSVSRFSPDAQKNEAIGLLVTSTEDSMFDLSEIQITTIALFRAFDENVVKLPGTMKFLESYSSLSRSKDRGGRYEFAASHAQRLISYIKSIPQTILPETQPEPPQKQGFFSKFMKGGGQ